MALKMTSVPLDQNPPFIFLVKQSVLMVRWVLVVRASTGAVYNLYRSSWHNNAQAAAPPPPPPSRVGKTWPAEPWRQGRLLEPCIDACTRFLANPGLLIWTSPPAPSPHQPSNLRQHWDCHDRVAGLKRYHLRGSLLHDQRVLGLWAAQHTP